VSKSSKVIKAGVGYTVGNYLLKGINFFAIPVFARLMATGDYGIYSTYIAYESFFSHFVGLALYMSLKNAKIKYEKEYFNYVKSMLVLQVMSMLFWGVIFFVFKTPMESVTGFSIQILFCMLIHAFCSSVLSMYSMHLSLSFSYKSYLKIAMFNAIANIGFSILFIATVFEDNAYLGRIIGTVAPLVIIALYILWYLWKKGKKIKKEYAFYGLKYSLPLIPHAVSQMVLSQFDRIMISKIIGAVEAGIYSFAYNIYMIVEVTKGSLDGVWGPWFYEKMKAGEKVEIRNRCADYAFGMLLFTVGIVCISPELVLILGGKKYINAIYVVIPITITGYYSFLYTFPAQLEYFYEKTKYISIGTICAALVNVFLNILYIPRYGYVAAAYTTEITYILYFLLHYIIAWKLGGKEIFPHKKIFLYAICCGGIGVIAVATIEKIIIRWSVALVCILIFIICFGRKIWFKGEK